MREYYLFVLSVFILILGAFSFPEFLVSGFWLMVAIFLFSLISYVHFNNWYLFLIMIFLAVTLLTGTISMLLFSLTWASFGVLFLGLLGWSILFIKGKSPHTKESLEVMIDKSELLEREVPMEEPPKVVVTDIEEGYVASKSGSVFHSRDCPVGQAIKPENRISFNSKKQARDAGFKPHWCVS